MLGRLEDPWKAESGPWTGQPLWVTDLGPGPGQCLIRFTHFLPLYLACSQCRYSSGWLPTDDASKQKHLEEVLRCCVPESRTERGNREVGERAGPTVRDGVTFLPPPN